MVPFIPQVLPRTEVKSAIGNAAYSQRGRDEGDPATMGEYGGERIGNQGRARMGASVGVFFGRIPAYSQRAQNP